MNRKEVWTNLKSELEKSSLASKMANFSGFFKASRLKK